MKRPSVSLNKCPHFRCIAIAALCYHIALTRVHGPRTAIAAAAAAIGNRRLRKERALIWPTTGRASASLYATGSRRHCHKRHAAKVQLSDGGGGDGGGGERSVMRRRGYGGDGERRSLSSRLRRSPFTAPSLSPLQRRPRCKFVQCTPALEARGLTSLWLYTSRDAY